MERSILPVFVGKKQEGGRWLAVAGLAGITEEAAGLRPGRTAEAAVPTLVGILRLRSG